MDIRHLFNEDGTPFDLSELQRIKKQLDKLNGDKRTEYRNQNAAMIAEHGKAKILIVSGPGTGKSHLFLDKINHWFQSDPDARVFVTSFVRKLVTDLQSDIDNDEQLSHEQKKQTTVTTLHKFARSIVEMNHGTSAWQFRPHFRIIAQPWKDVVWRDVLAYYPNLDENDYLWANFERQLHNNEFTESEEWQKLRQAYFELCEFYNAAGFAGLIIRARIALDENPQLNEDNFFIIDEYQDFNPAEEALIFQLVNNLKGLLVVGDDEQVLYEKLKSGQAALIRRLYKNQDMANAMLPFCGRSSYHITKSAAHFIQQHRDSECIEKIYLPLKTCQDTPKVQIIACATPATAVDYIEKFISDNKSEIEERKIELLEGKAKDAFLLILTPEKGVKFYGNAKEKIHQTVSNYQTEIRAFSEDYYKVLNYYSLGKNPRDNFTFRKVIFYENYTENLTHALVDKAVQNNKNFCDLPDEEIKYILKKCGDIKNIIEAESVIDEKIDKLLEYVSLWDKARLKDDIERQAISRDQITRLEHGEEEEAELEEIEVRRMCAVELMTIVGSKGLSADHVMIIGFDNINMKWITKNAFYVAMTRARKSLHILTTLKSGGATKPHKFLDQLPETHAEFYRYKKTGSSKTALNSKEGFVRYLDRVNSASRRRE